MPDQQQTSLHSKLSKSNSFALLPIPDKLYFTIGEVSNLCDLRQHVLRYWEQEFPQLKPNKRRGNRRYYQRNEVMLIRRIKQLLYEQGFTIDGARSKLIAEQKAPQASTSSPSLSTDFIEKLIQQLQSVVNELEIEC